jgi:xylulokinase
MSGTILGLDIGSSSVKACLLDAESGRVVAQASSPSEEMAISASQAGWAEQHPDLWWEHVRRCLDTIRSLKPAELKASKAVGITYQMHGLVVVDRDGNPLRRSIIWCDSRAVLLGERAFKAIGEDRCLKHLGNSPGNFTAAKLAWVKENEPQTLEKAAYFMLPGDYIALKLSGQFGTTPSGLSEGILWDFERKSPAVFLLEHFGLSPALIPPITPNCGTFATVRAEIARELGLAEGTPITYRAGDQPNNALALNVLNPGEIAANAGTSGVIYGVTKDLGIDQRSRVNNFLHVNHTEENPRVGILMCVNGTGSCYRWVRQTFAPGSSYTEMNALAEQSPIGSRGLTVIPYGNGAERTLGNALVGASITGIDLNTHTRPDVFRATQEGIVFALNYGLEIMRGMGLSPTRVRAGAANMFQSPLFRQTFATVTGVSLELYTTDGSEGAARGAGIGVGMYSTQDAFRGLTKEAEVEPNHGARAATLDAYARWRELALKAL